MGLRQHSAALLGGYDPLHPRMAIVVRGFGDVSVEVSRRSLLRRSLAVRVEGMVMLGWEADRYLLARPPEGGWPAGTIDVVPRSYGDAFGEVRLLVGRDEPVAPPTFAFVERRLERPKPYAGLLGNMPPSRPAPFYIPGPTVTQTSLGLVTGVGPLVELTVALSNGQRLNGWTYTGSHAAANFEPPVEGVTIVGALVRDLVGNEVVYGDFARR